MESTLTSVKMYLKFFYDDGEWADKPVVYFAGKEADPRACGFIKNLLKFLLESNYTSDSTKMFLNSQVTSIKGAIDFYNNSVEPDKKLDYITSKNAIQYDKRKLDKALGGDAVTTVLYNPDLVNECQSKLNALIKKTMGKSVQAQALAFDVQVPGLSSEELSTEDFQQLLMVLNRYSKKRLERLGKGLLKELPEDSLKYFNYLTSTDVGTLSIKEQFYLSKINEALGIQGTPEGEVDSNGGLE